ncbi:MAG: sn-glycerol-3-phosphate ABC transporter ATP-binding protein UgpC, partial [Pseudomonadota bacterium]
MAKVDYRNIAKSFGAVEVIRDLDLTIEEGEFAVLLGSSGCGKTTLLRMTAGLETISAGELTFDGKRMNEVHPRERDVAMVFQNYALYPTMKVFENIAFSLEIKGVSKADVRAKVEEAARVLNLTDYLGRYPRELSGGQRQRVAMGRALVREPDVFLFDEPLSNLDAKLRVDMRTEIKKLHQNLGTTIVYVTHDQIEAMTLSTRIAVMNGGYVQQLGTPKEIYDTPANLFVATFMGSPSMNLLKVKVRVDGNAVYADTHNDQGEPVSLAFFEPGASLKSYDGKTVMLGIRPEALTDVDGADQRSTHVERIENTVT